MPKPKKYKCNTKHCRNMIRFGKMCSTCRSRKCRKKDPIRAAYLNLKNHAKGKCFFGLTLQQFKKFCYKTQYHTKKGIAREGYAVDRKKVGYYPGYVLSNIQALPNYKNSQKRWIEYDWQYKVARVHKHEPIQDVDLPF